MQKELTVQELENINLELYKENPSELISIGKKLVSSSRYEKAIEIFEFGLKNIIARNNNNEFHIDCAKFNYHYADALIAKLFESNDLFNNENLPGEEERKEIKENFESKEENNNNLTSPPKNEKNIEENNNEMEKGENEEEEEDEDDDERIAFEHLGVAEKTLKTFLEKYGNVAVAELSANIINYYLDLSDVYFKFGELELVKSDFKNALDFFNQSVKYKILYDTKYSRAIAEVYFMMASACDADAQQALVFYLKTYLILIYHLKKDKGFDTTDINIDFDTIAAESVKLDKEILKIDINDSDKIKGLKETLNDVIIKIEDVCEEIKITKDLISEKVAMNIEKIAFSQNYDDNKVVDISKSGMIKKKNDIYSKDIKGENANKLNK